MRIILDTNKSIEENAGIYFDKSKKAKKKLEGLEEAIIKTKAKLASKLKEERIEKKKAVDLPPAEWYEKFRWFITSNGHLVLGGRDATSNEIVIKKHTEPKDIVFHTDMAGSPFFIIKHNEKKIEDIELEEAATATASYSRAWKLGLQTVDVFHVEPHQVSKTTKAGEYMPRGAFMIKGKTTYIHPRMELSVGKLKDGRIMGGPERAVKKNCEKYIIIKQGTLKPGQASKKIMKLLDAANIELVQKVLPAGNVDISMHR